MNSASPAAVFVEPVANIRAVYLVRVGEMENHGASRFGKSMGKKAREGSAQPGGGHGTCFQEYQRESRPGRRRNVALREAEPHDELRRDAAKDFGEDFPRRRTRFLARTAVAVGARVSPREDRTHV